MGFGGGEEEEVHAAEAGGDAGGVGKGVSRRNRGLVGLLDVVATGNGRASGRTLSLPIGSDTSGS